jgi:hypothetical protein
MLVRYSTVQVYQIFPTSSSNMGKVLGVSRFTRFSLEMSQILGGQMKGYYFVKKNLDIINKNSKKVVFVYTFIKEFERKSYTTSV